MAVTNTWTNPTALDRNTGQTIREQDWDGVLSDLMVLGGSNGSSGVSKYNLLTNGGFEIWQRWTGSAITANGVYSADRWFTTLGGTDALSISKDTSNVDTANGSRAAAACMFTLGTGAGASNLSQSVKAADGYEIANRVLSGSVRIRTNVPNAVRIGLHNGSAWTYVASHTGDGTWQTLTVSATMAAGPAELGVFFAASCTAYIDNAMLVVGSVPADYAPLHPADDLARCLRYYEGSSTSLPAVSGRADSATQATYGYKYTARKGGAPTVTLGPAAGAYVNTTTGNTQATGFTGTSPSIEDMVWSVTVAGGLVAGQGVLFYKPSAVLTVEWNP